MPQREGRLLCSPRDPQMEAKKWCARYPQVSNKPVVIIGLGAGHHVLEWIQQNQHSEVVVLEKDQSFLDAFECERALPENLKIIAVKSVESFVGSELWISLLENGFHTLAFKPAWQGAEKFFLDLYLGLTQSSVASFTQACEYLGLSLSKREILSASENVKALSPIHHLAEVPLNPSQQAAEVEELLLWKCLREMVK